MGRAAHEAGHALTLLYFGGELIDVALRGGAGYTRGRDPAAGLRAWRRGEPTSRSAEIRVEIAVIVALAGVVAEGLSGISVVDEDAAAVSAALAILPPGERERAMIRGERRARALIFSAPGQRFIARLSRRLIRDRRLEGAVGRSLFRAAFGYPPPALRAWLTAWPPSLAQLSRGALPAPRKTPTFLIRKAA